MREAFAMAASISDMPIVARVECNLAAKVGQAFLPAAQTGMSATLHFRHRSRDRPACLRALWPNRA